jgi:DNA (cytosine-5)-methyltransferase 1
MRFGSLFSGIGGIDLGLERAGMRCAWQVEIDPFCRKVLAKHWPDVPKFEDVRTFPPEPTDDCCVDLIAGGFPCQPVSQAGKKRTQDDERWLWPEFARVVRVLMPRYVFLENVPGLLVRGFGDVLRDLATLGFDARWDCISAAAIGAPHRRDRVWVVAYPTGTRRQGCWTQCGLGEGQGKMQAGGESWWATESGVCRVANGIPNRMDRLRALGNSVVPQVVEWIGRRIMALTPPAPAGKE